MSEKPAKDAQPAGAGMRSVRPDALGALATRALSVIAARPQRQIPQADSRLVDLLLETVLNDPGFGAAPLIEMVRAWELPPEEIADVYIPATARALGEMWLRDETGFAGVTIGTARLQALLRELGPEWRADHGASPESSTVIVLVASDVHHTLGAMVLSGQLRRRGLSVRLILGARPQDVGPLLRQARFDAVMISASCGETLDSVKRLVEAVKTSTVTSPPVVLGGTILGAAEVMGGDLRALTGADHVTCDPNEAIELCGLTATLHNDATLRMGS